jgi:TonB family protein
MPLKFASTIAITTSLCVGSALHARAPTGRWNVNFADAQCHASRDYGTVQDPVQLILKAPVTGGVMQVAIVRRAGWAPPNQIDATVTAGNAQPFRASILTYTPKGSEYRVYLINMSPPQFALVQAASELSVRAEHLDESFSLSNMVPLLKIVDECVADLRRVFNVTDPPESSPLKSRARGRIISYFEGEIYPPVALDRDQTGVVKFTLLVDESGRVADCTIVETSGVAALDSQVCAVLKPRARLEPAVGMDGRPAKDVLTGKITWKM